ncbi:MAG TPA: hypothetical protein VMI06_04080, partial [Terriglobia bacterium]|nr:hypothetical protein [Terriglobia bacterium]
KLLAHGHAKNQTRRNLASDYSDRLLVARIETGLGSIVQMAIVVADFVPGSLIGIVAGTCYSVAEASLWQRLAP